MGERIKERFAEAYEVMAREVKYRPAAPGDGCGNVRLSDEELRDGERLWLEGRKYAEEFFEEDEARTFRLGCAKWETNRALVYTVEAARSLCAANEKLAERLLRLALREVRRIG